ncbi:dimethylaniline monooxygenase [N-oxide-forming] 5-like [Pecten maximus]|uniref:dimethylaniline monooxygenase [N-oxide-forming] 5-like n=1 Tax=Pecten maximus TaxID=6579 RepID=UPI001457F6A9|nr:dimethylaniline monooxygenase [N-oxide-forming] 5-like [Pecten maximus]
MKTIAIIGAGCSGLTAIKCCIDEELIPVCFERENDIGGLWNYKENSKVGTGSVYRSCVMNTSKEMMAFSDFPPPEDFPVFLPHRYVNNYFQLYADNFDLRKYIKFRTIVTRVVPSPDYDQTGCWDVTYCSCSGSDFEKVTRRFDGILICTGHHTFPMTPEFEGKDGFQGKVMHTHSYRSNKDLTDQNVLVVGIGNSGADIAVDISHAASQVYLSTRRGAWIINRKGFWGLPADAMANSRFAFMLPKSALQWGVEKMSNFNFDHKKYGIKPANRALQSHPTINDELPLRLLTGCIKIKPNVRKFAHDKVSFEDGSSEKIDTVIFATGYNYTIPIVDESITRVKENETCLYKFMYPPHLQHPTLGIIGLVQAIGAVMPISEIQCRWYTRVIKGLCKLPTEAEMMADIARKRETVASGYYTAKRHTIQTFWIDYMDDVAEQIGVKPNLRRMVFEDPYLALNCVFGPCLPAQYRLEGPGKWNGAKSSILNAMNRYSASMRSKVMPKNHSSSAMKNIDNSSASTGNKIIDLLTRIGIRKRNSALTLDKNEHSSLITDTTNSNIATFPTFLKSFYTIFIVMFLFFCVCVV